MESRLLNRAGAANTTVSTCEILRDWRSPQKKGGRERKRWGCEARSKDIRDGILNDSFAIRLSFPPPPPLSVPESALSDACRAAIYCLPPPPPSLSHVDRSESSKKHDDSVPSRNGLPNLLWNLLFGDRAPPSPRMADPG